MCFFPFPTDPIPLSEDDEAVVQSVPLAEVFRFHETILSFGEPGFVGFLSFGTLFFFPTST